MGVPCQILPSTLVSMSSPSRLENHVRFRNCSKVKVLQLEIGNRKLHLNDLIIHACKQSNVGELTYFCNLHSVQICYLHVSVDNDDGVEGEVGLPVEPAV